MAEAPSEDPPMEVLSIGNDGSSVGPGAVGHQSAATKPAKKVHCCMHVYNIQCLKLYALLFFTG